MRSGLLDKAEQRSLSLFALWASPDRRSPQDSEGQLERKHQQPPLTQTPLLPGRLVRPITRLRAIRERDGTTFPVKMMETTPTI